MIKHRLLLIGLIGTMLFIIFGMNQILSIFLPRDNNVQQQCRADISYINVVLTKTNSRLNHDWDNHHHHDDDEKVSSPLINSPANGVHVNDSCHSCQLKNLQLVGSNNTKMFKGTK